MDNISNCGAFYIFCVSLRAAPAMRSQDCLQVQCWFIFVAAVVFGSPTDLCEKIDGDCPVDCSGHGRGNLGFVAKFYISPFHLKTEIVAERAEKYITTRGVVSRFDSPWVGLHTSLFYFCCHTIQEKEGIKQALKDMPWESFDIHYNSFACNVDHNNKTVYLHSLPRNQANLFAFAAQIEETVVAANFTVNHPRKSKFHMTLARVNHSFPTDQTVRYFLNHTSEWDFGTLKMDRFQIDDTHYTPN